MNNDNGHRFMIIMVVFILSMLAAFMFKSCLDYDLEVGRMQTQQTNSEE